MAKDRIFIDKQELVHRFCNGFITHDGDVDGKFTDLFKEAGITYDRLLDDTTEAGKAVRIFAEIIDSLPEWHVAFEEDQPLDAAWKQAAR